LASIGQMSKVGEYLPSKKGIPTPAVPISFLLILLAPCRK
jgi:hypothetical protein